VIFYCANGAAFEFWVAKGCTKAKNEKAMTENKDEVFLTSKIRKKHSEQL
jgi:hypothetical protein